jgi:hypothetical protein
MSASTLALEKRLELFVAADANPMNKTQHFVERLVSYNNGDTWIDNWIQNDDGIFSSSPAAAITGDNLDTFITAKGQDNRFLFARLSEYFDFKNISWSPIGIGVFTGRPAICCFGNSTYRNRLGSDGLPKRETLYDGVHVMVFGRGMDKKIWWAISSTGGNTWDMAWKSIGTGVFSSSPAAVCSADGKLLAVFCKGKDDKIWWAYSTTKGSSWDMAWKSIGEGTFVSSPAAVCSADGKRIYVFGRGKDNKIWWAFATNGVQKWDMAWKQIGEGIFVDNPSASCSWDGKIIHVFGKGTDNRIWQARSYDFGATWNIAWRKVHSKKFVLVDL